LIQQTATATEPAWNYLLLTAFATNPNNLDDASATEKSTFNTQDNAPWQLERSWRYRIRCCAGW